jgi:hypothetical protein
MKMMKRDKIVEWIQKNFNHYDKKLINETQDQIDRIESIGFFVVGVKKFNDEFHGECIRYEIEEALF